MAHIEISGIGKKDFSKAIEFALVGMHFDAYFKSRLMAKLYTRYFWDSELLKATHAIGARADGRFVGFMLASFVGEPRLYGGFLRKAYVAFVELVQRIFFKGMEAYDEANARMLKKYKETCHPDGEILFLAANPFKKIPGVGTALLCELAKREPGKLVYLFTDSNCTYGFYDKRGFKRVGEKMVELETPAGTIPLDCFLYAKKL